MERRGNFVYLTIQEQRVSGYSSPIKLDQFDLHAEREAADSALDSIEQEQMAIADDQFQVGAFKQEYEQALSRAQITRAIAKSLAQDALVEVGLKQLKEFLENPQDNL